MDPNYCIRRVSRWSWYSRAKSHKKVMPFLNDRLPLAKTRL